MRMMPAALLLTALFAFSPIVLAGDDVRKALDHDVYESWNRIEDPVLSADGRWLSWRQTREQSDAQLLLQDLQGDQQQSFELGENAQFSRDSAHLVFRLAVPFAKAREAELDKDLSKPIPGLAILPLGAEDAYVVEHVSSFKLPKDNGDWLFYEMQQPGEDAATDDAEATSVEDAEGNGESANEAEKPAARLVIRHLASGAEREFEPLGEYAISDQGNRLLFSLKDGDSAGVYTMAPDDAQPLRLFDGKAEIASMVVHEQGDRLAFTLRPVIESEEEDMPKPSLRLKYWQQGADRAVLLADDQAGFLSAGWQLSEHGELSFSDSGQRLFFATAPAPVEIPDNDDKLDREVVTVDIWHWQDSLLQPMQLEQLEQERKRSYMAVAHLGAEPRLVQLADTEVPEIELDESGDADRVLAISNRPYEKQISWDFPRYYDAFVVDVNSGQSTRVLEKVQDRPSLSPGGQYISWWDRDQASWWAHSTLTGERVDLGQAIGTDLQDHTNDRPFAAGAYGSAGWLANDAAFVVYDRFDIWRVEPSRPQEPENLTAGYGQENAIRLRWLDLDADTQALDGSAPVLLHGFAETSKASGYLRGQADGSLAPERLLWGDFAVNRPIKADNADVLVYTRETFREFPNLRVSDLTLADSRQVSDANPQQADYLWGDVELVHWQSETGIDHDGLLFTPEDMDRDKPHPMIVYFYERDSDGLHRHRAPMAHRSVIIPSFYTSRGYVVFVPDVHYREGYPGDSAMESIMPKTRALADEPWIDADRVGIQGHSWAGYQIAYMVSHTDFFRAAAGGAPVSNMISAYGGIRWRTGMSRMFQYERTQSRLGKTLWQAPELYIHNSPIFRADHINTPLLMMHNDKDGAVPWEQGIELFTALRRLQRPAWLINYNDEPHWPTTFANRRDWQIRLQQFLDHYLKDEPAPRWLSHGVPALEKGATLGLEPVED